MLHKLGVPEILTCLLESFHNNMSADMSTGDSFVDGISVRYGLRQTCTMAPVLFNLLAAALIERWLAQLVTLA